MSGNEDVLAAIQDLSGKVLSLQQDVNLLKSADSSSSSSQLPRPPIGISPTPRKSLTWADRMESPDPEDQTNYGAHLSWEDQPASLTKVSDETSELLMNAFTRSVDNASRQKARSSFILPDCPALRTPRLDSVLKAEASASTKSLDKDLAKIQTFVLDAAGPLTHALEEAQSDDGLTTDVALEAIKAALMLLGNSNARISRLRRQKVLTEFNKSLQPLADKDEEFTNAAPDLFGPEFAKRAKDHLDQVKSLRSAKKETTTSGPASSFFRAGPSGNRGGQKPRFFGNRRGGYQQRHQPYQQDRKNPPRNGGYKNPGNK